MTQIRLFQVSEKEKRIEALYRSNLQPLLKELGKSDSMRKLLNSTNLFGASPPAVFIGQWGYPNVLAGPLVPPIADSDTAIMDNPQAWLNESLLDIVKYRVMLLRGKAMLDVQDASHPSKLLATIQESVMSPKPTDMEVWLRKRPTLRLNLLARDAPSGPSAPMLRAELAENPNVPKPVDYVVSDRDLSANQAIVYLYKRGISQQQSTRLLSVGLLGVKSQRRLVPTEWSITAVDDMLGKALRRKVLGYPGTDEYLIFGHKAVANNVQILLMPSAWMFEALEAWLTSANPVPESDFELTMGRTTYPKNILGAYHATRLPVLEYLDRIGRQAGAIVFMEVARDWLPLGVWRFREISREALKRQPVKARSLNDSLEILRGRFEVPIERWVQASRLVATQRRQKLLKDYF